MLQIDTAITKQTIPTVGSLDAGTFFTVGQVSGVYMRTNRALYKLDILAVDVETGNTCLGGSFANEPCTPLPKGTKFTII